MIDVALGGALRDYAGGVAELALYPKEGATVAEALSQLWARHPALRDRVLDERGEIRRHVNIFVGEDNVRDLQGLATKLGADASLFIAPAVSGG